MPHASFYVLPVAEPQARLTFACRLAEKAWFMGHRVYLHCADAAQARALDELLWSFRAGAFVPHGLHLDATGAADSPVLIGIAPETCPDDAVLINLADAGPELAARCARVAEIVLQDPDALDASRRRYALYRERGFALAHHHIPRLGGTHEP